MGGCQQNGSRMIYGNIKTQLPLPRALKLDKEELIIFSRPFHVRIVIQNDSQHGESRSSRSSSSLVCSLTGRTESLHTIMKAINRLRVKQQRGKQKERNTFPVCGGRTRSVKRLMAARSRPNGQFRGLGRMKSFTPRTLRRGCSADALFSIRFQGLGIHFLTHYDIVEYVPRERCSPTVAP